MNLKIFILVALVCGVALGMSLPGRASKPAPESSQFKMLGLS